MLLLSLLCWTSIITTAAATPLSAPPPPDVSIDGASNGGLAIAARVAARHITARSNATVAMDAPAAAIHMVLALDTTLGPEAFTVADLGPAGPSCNGVSVVGGDARGLYYGVGKLLRGSNFSSSFALSAWRGRSAPTAPNGFRAMYLATHLQNFYQAAPIEKVKEYIEDLALWGANTVALVMPWEEFSSFEDPMMVQQINMTATLFRVAQETGMGVGLVAAANQGFKSRPESIKACYPLPDDHFGEFNARMPQVSTVKDGGVAYLLKNFGQLFQMYKAQKVELDFFISWPYDEGGSACTGPGGDSEWPWGAVGFPNITHQLADLAKKTFPQMRTIVSTWGFDRPSDSGEFAGLDQYIRNNPGAFDFTMADSNTDFPAWPLAHGRGPGGLPLLNFPEISMWGRVPWGGFGANPLPVRFQTLWSPIENLVSGGMPYSEGIFDDLNQAICFRHYWNSSETAASTVTEYVRYEFSRDPQVVSAVSDAITLLEEDYPMKNAKAPCFYPECGDQTSNSNSRCVQALDLLKDAERSLTKEVRESWRWRALLDRAVIDAGLEETHGQVTGPVLTAAFADLVTIYYAAEAYPAVKPPSPVNASVHNCSAPPKAWSSCPLDAGRGPLIPWVRVENVSNVWGTNSAQPRTPILGHFPTELQCRAKCTANENCTQYVWDARATSLACFGRCDTFWEPHPTPPADGIVSGRRVNVKIDDSVPT